PGSVELDEHQFIIGDEGVENLGGESDNLLWRGLVVGIDTGLNPVDNSLFISASIVIHWFSFLPKLESGISLDIVSLADLSLHSTNHLGKGSTQFVGGFLVLGSEVLAVTAP
ncbi:hypothetical protein PENTCL1PPCAC_11760, partial [Pristionchus entomophagus]